MDKQGIYDSLSRQGATSLMNNRRWGRLLYVLGNLPVCYRVKILDSPSVSDWHPSNTYTSVPSNELFLDQIGAIHFLQIHWLEVKSLNDDADGKITALIEGISKTLRKPCTRDGSTFRIWGHVLQSDIVSPDEENS